MSEDQPAAVSLGGELEALRQPGLGAYQAMEWIDLGPFEGRAAGLEGLTVCA